MRSTYPDRTAIALATREAYQALAHGLITEAELVATIQRNLGPEYYIAPWFNPADWR